MKIKHLSTLLCVLLCYGAAQAQCDPQKLCAEEVLVDTITSAAPVSYDCFDAQNTSIFYFNTNNSPSNQGGVDITVSNIDCPDPLNNDEIEMIVIELDNPNGNPCEPLNWTGAIGCANGNSEVVMSIDDADLSNEAGYALIIGNDQDPADLSCAFEVQINGMWVDIDACCDTDIILGDVVDLEAEGSDAGYHWTADQPAEFNDPNVQNPTFAPTMTTNVMVSGEVDGCEVTDMITIFVNPPIDVLNTFTPNGDGINDTFEIFGINRFENAQVAIYDRWGQLIFKSIGYTRVWDGTNKGKKLPPATYYYVIELNSIDVEIPPYTGWVTILY